MLAIIKADNTNKYLCTDVCMYVFNETRNKTQRNETNDKKKRIILKSNSRKQIES